MQGDRTLPREKTAEAPTLSDLLAAGELTCSALQVARWLRVSMPTVRAAAKRGELPGHLVGRQWRFSTQELARMWGVPLVPSEDSRLAPVADPNPLNDKRPAGAVTTGRASHDPREEGHSHARP